MFLHLVLQRIGDVLESGLAITGAALVSARTRGQIEVEVRPSSSGFKSPKQRLIQRIQRFSASMNM